MIRRCSAMGPRLPALQPELCPSPMPSSRPHLVFAWPRTLPARSWQAPSPPFHLALPVDGADMETENSAGSYVRAVTEGCLLWLWNQPKDLCSQWHFRWASFRHTVFHTGFATVDKWLHEDSELPWRRPRERWPHTAIININSSNKKRKGMKSCHLQ